MIDENAFGLLITHHDLEDEEYASAPEAFADRVVSFRAVVHDWIADAPPAPGMTALDLGHGIYCELASDELTLDLVAWLRDLRARLAERDFESTGVVTYGGRWVDEDSGALAAERWVGTVRLLQASLPSEPLRRALAVDAASRGRDAANEDDDGWGPGLYADADALESMGKRFKNAPTPLPCGDAVFYRLGR
ncbi:MAG: hypothetical protein IT376_02885 [Polyangiaceae bacterium]|nr:hypothetical protein [Polyangiaceae bacterium]